MHFNISMAIASLVLLFMGVSIAHAVEDDRKIKSITINCDYSVFIPSKVSEKLNVTFQKTLERILIENDSRSIESYIQNKQEIESSIISGLNIVLEPKGYTIEALNLDISETTKADFKVKPFGRYVKNISVNLETGSFHPFWVSRFNRIFKEAQNDLIGYYSPFLMGLPVSAEDSDWAFSLEKDNIYNIERIKSLFTHMSVEISADIAETASINVSLEPSGNLVRTFRVRALSRSMFMLTLDSLKELVTSNSNMLVGMPVELVKSAHEDIETEFAKIVDDDLLARKFGARSQLRLYFIETEPLSAYLEMKTESRMFHFRAEALVDIGNDEAPTEFEAHAGALIGDIFECFTHLNFFPDDVRFEPDIGFGVHPFDSTFIATAWDVNNNIWKLLIEQYITPLLHIDIEAFDKDEGQDQYGIVYKPFQSVSFGIFSDGDDDYWLRASFAF